MTKSLPQPPAYRLRSEEKAFDGVNILDFPNRPPLPDLSQMTDDELRENLNRAMSSRTR